MRTLQYRLRALPLQWGVGHLGYHDPRSLQMVYVMTSHVCTLSAITSSTSSSKSKSCRLERAKTWDVELLHGWWGWHCGLIHCVARCRKRRRLLLHRLLIRRELVDCRSDRCTCLCCRTSRQLTLSCQGRHLRDYHVDFIIVVLRFFCQCSICILYISLCPSCDASCIKLTCVGFLDERF